MSQNYFCFPRILLAFLPLVCRGLLAFLSVLMPVTAPESSTRSSFTSECRRRRNVAGGHTGIAVTEVLSKHGDAW